MAGHVAGAWILRNRVPESLSARPGKRSRRRRPTAGPPAADPVTSADPRASVAADANVEAPEPAGRPVRRPSPVSLIPAPRRPWTSAAVLVGVGAGLWRRIRHRG